MSFAKEFKEFALKGNMIDLAIGVVIGAAFGKVVSSLVSDLIMPPIGLLLGGIDFSQLSIKLESPIKASAPVEIKYGVFLNTIIDFLIIALVIFLVIKFMNRLRKKSPQVEVPVTKPCPECFMEVPVNAKKCGHCCSVLRGPL
jgi:large conductance mechanosensitive channel